MNESRLTGYEDVLLGPIKTIIAEELPEYYMAEIDLTFDNLCEGQEDNFKLFYRTRSETLKKGQVRRSQNVNIS